MRAAVAVAKWRSRIAVEAAADCRRPSNVALRRRWRSRMMREFFGVLRFARIEILHLKRHGGDEFRFFDAPSKPPKRPIDDDADEEEDGEENNEHSLESTMRNDSSLGAAAVEHCRKVGQKLSRPQPPPLLLTELAADAKRQAVRIALRGADTIELQLNERAAQI